MQMQYIRSIRKVEQIPMLSLENKILQNDNVDFPHHF